MPASFPVSLTLGTRLFPCIQPQPPPDIIPTVSVKTWEPFGRSHTFTPEMPQRLLDISAALIFFVYKQFYIRKKKKCEEVSTLSSSLSLKNIYFFFHAARLATVPCVTVTVCPPRKYPLRVWPLSVIKILTIILLLR